MENIRSIKEKIRSCISCDQNQCPMIKERLDHHVLSHHSSFKRSFSNQQITPHQRHSKIIYASRNNASGTKTDEQTSTSDLIDDKGKEKLDKPSYKEGLRAIVLECIKTLLANHNASDGNEEQNRINEFIENISKLSIDETGANYDVKLNAEIDNFLYFLPLNIDKQNEIIIDNLKSKIATKIFDFNKNIANNSSVRNESININAQKNLKNKGTTTESINYIENNKTDAFAQNSDINILINSFNDNDNSLTRFNPNNNTSPKKTSVETQVPRFLSECTEGIIDLNSNTYVKRNSSDDNTVLKGKNIKKIIKSWLFQLNDEINLNVGYSDIQSVTEELYNRLLTLFTTENDTLRSKIVLKEEIMNFLNEFFSAVMANYNSAQINRHVENLAISLITETANYEKSYFQEQNMYFLKHFEKNIAKNKELEKIKPILHEIITKHLENKTSSNSKTLIENILVFFSRNLHLIHRKDCRQLEVMLFNFLKTTTDISDLSATDIVNSIIKAINNNTVVDISSHSSSTMIKSHNQHCFRNLISLVFKSEQELIEPSNNPGPPVCKQKSSILKKTKINSEEQMYTAKLADLMMSWVNALPNKHSKSKNKKLKELLINKLVEDILDQVKLEQIAPETSNEKDKYLSFFIYRWLNRYEYYEDINEAKLYVDQLVEKIKDIPRPNLIKTQIATQKTIENINLEKSASTYQEPLVSNELNLLTNEILNWSNEQPCKIFLQKDESKRNEIIQKFALKIHEMINKCLPEQLNKEIKDWLVEIITPDNEQNITTLAEILESKIEKFVTNKKNEEIQKASEQKRDNTLCCSGSSTDSIISENTLKDLIVKYLEHKYDSENFIARKAYTQLFKNELQKFNLSNADTNMSIDKQQQTSTPDNLPKELQYIKIICDWLKNIPLQESFNNTGNTVRAESVISLAKKIQEMEDTQKSCCEKDYKYYISLLLSEFTKNIPIPAHFKNNMQVTNDLVSKIITVKHISPLNPHLTINSAADHNLTDYIEAYIQENDEEIFEDDLKLEACILRLFGEICDITNKNAIDHNTCVFNISDNKSLSSNEKIKKFTFKMKCAKEIADWLKNLPLLPITDKTVQNQLVVSTNNLAIKISETESGSELTNYVTNWISELPLDPNKEIVIPVVIQQIMNRVKRINEGDIQAVDQTQRNTSEAKDEKSHNNICIFPQSCCNKNIISHENDDPGTVIVEAVEEWCKNLPIQAENEIISTILKENLATKLFQKLGELNMNPEYFNNDIVYEKMLSEEMDEQLQNLPPNPNLQTLKRELLKVIIEQRKEIKKKSSGVTYKHDLEKTVEVLMPYPVPTQHDNSCAFKIYKDRLATIFILENFDHGNDAVKFNYEKRIRKEIDKYFHEIQDKNSVSLANDQIYNELYSALFSVPLPNENSMIDEVEEIKTKCEIDTWFETLPLREAAGVGELLEWDQILSMLAKRLHDFEKYDKDCDNKMHKEITKWLVRLPILPSQTSNIELFANSLQQRLKSTVSNRKYVPRTSNKSQQSVVDEDSSKVKGSRYYLQLTSSPTLPPCCQASNVKSSKKPADIILEIVETWCQQLPLPANTSQEKDNVKVIKDNLIIKIIMKISELNMNPETFNDEFLYDTLLVDELENLLSRLPVSYEFIQSKNARKDQLKEAIKAVKPLIKEDKARYEYKIDIKNTVDKTLENHHETSTERSILLDSLKEEIVDNFIIYNFHKQNQEKSWEYKSLVHDAVKKYYNLIDTNGDETHTQQDPLLKSNQLLCELAKIPSPGENAILKETQEIQIKFELIKLFNEVSFTEDKEKVILKNQIKNTLAKQLINSVNSDDIFANDSKIKENVIKRLKKFNENIDPKIVDEFVKRLKYLISDNLYSSSLSHTNGEIQHISYQDEKEKTMTKLHEADISHEDTKDEQWMSLLPVTPKFQDSNYHGSLEPKELTKTAVNIRSRKEQQNFDHSSNQSGMCYESIDKGTLLSSSIRKHNDTEQVNTYGQVLTLTSNQNEPCSPTCSNKTAKRSSGTNHTQQRFAQIDQPTGPEDLTSAVIKLDKAQKSQLMEDKQKDNFKTPVPYIHRSTNKDFIDNQSNAHQPHQPNFPISVPDRRRLDSPCMFNQFPQRTSSRTSQTSNQSQTGHELYNQSLYIPADHFPSNTQDAYTQKTGLIQPPASTRPISNEPSIPFQNIRESHSTIPSTSIPLTTPMSHSCVRGQPCRRPSINIFSPPGLQRCDGLEQTSAIGCNTVGPITEDELETCECFNKRKRPRLCSIHMRRHCRICNEINPFYCRMPYRYPSFYYH